MREHTLHPQETYCTFYPSLMQVKSNIFLHKFQLKTDQSVNITELLQVNLTLFYSNKKRKSSFDRCKIFSVFKEMKVCWSPCCVFTSDFLHTMWLHSEQRTNRLPATLNCVQAQAPGHASHTHKLHVVRAACALASLHKINILKRLALAVTNIYVLSRFTLFCSCA